MIKLIFCQGMRRSDLREKLQDQTWQAMICLAQLYLYPDSLTRNHWITELWNKYMDLPAVRGTRKSVSAEFIFNSTFPTQSKQKLSHLIKFVEDKENKPAARKDVSYLTLIKFIEDYFRWMSRTLSNQQVIERSQVANFVNDYIF